MAFEAGSSNARNTLTSEMIIEKVALIVDDDRIIHTMHKILLSRFGYKTFVAENGKQAVDLFKSGARFDLITMDFHMPIMDGVEVSFFD